MAKTDLSVLFSGRFDPPHPGHILQILKLAKKWKKVKVVVLDYPERRFPIVYVMSVFQEIIDSESVEFFRNNIHFGEITEEEFKKFECDLYVGGNLTVLRHIEKMGIPCEYLPRALEFSSRHYPDPE